MYRLIGPRLVFFLTIIVIGVIVVTIIPKYYGAIRVLSFSALLLGEAGLSFLPVLALYPKATPFQAAMLAIIFFFTTFIICFSSSALNSIGIIPGTAFAFKSNEFVINTHSLFAANLFSFLALIINFRLVYDEELTKAVISKRKEAPYKMRSFMPFQKTLLARPVGPEIGTRSATTKRKKTEKKSLAYDPFEDEFTKPFEFETEGTAISPENLPEESSGKLFAPKKVVPAESSEFFEEEGNPFGGIVETIPKKSPKEASPFPPSNVMEDLQAIFEQYSSLNAVKKLTATKSEKLQEYQKRKLEKPRSEIVKEERKQDQEAGGEVFDATYRQITEEEKLLELKEELKKQLEEELHEKLLREKEEKGEVKERKTESKEEVLESIETIKDELKRELIESLKEEFKKEVVQSKLDSGEARAKKEISKEEADKYKDKVRMLKEDPAYRGLMFLDMDGNVIFEDWVQKQVLQGPITNSLTRLFELTGNEISKTSQSKLLHMLLESGDGTLLIALLQNQLLTVHTVGTGEAHTGSLLRKTSEIEEI